MLIVSQNKVSLANMDNINLIGTNGEGEIKARLGTNDNITLGTYKTEDRAKEVLQEIVKAYKGKILIQLQGKVPDNVMEEINENNKNDVIYYDLRSEVKQLTKVIYEMPQE